MNNVMLYVSTILIWSTTWIAIKLQVTDAPVEISIFYRFAVASFVLILWCLYKKVSLRFKLIDHFYLAFLGIFTFSFNYVFVYEGTKFIPSGIVAVTFAAVSFLSIIYNFIFFRIKPQANTIIGSLIGIGGLCVFFSDEIATMTLENDFLRGVLLCTTAVLIFTLGSMIMRRNQNNNLKNIACTAIGMLYGTAAILTYIFLQQTSFAFPNNGVYWSAVLYLAIPGSILGFLCYFQLIKNVGAELAGYSTVIIPIIALLISWAFEDYQFSIYDVIGLVLVISGNILVLRKKKT